MTSTNMNEEQVRRIIKEELKELIAEERYLFQKHLQIFDGRNVITGKGTGTKFGTEITQKMGFYGVPPVDQPETVTDADSIGATFDQNEVTSIASAVNGVIDTLQELGLMA